MKPIPFDEQNGTIGANQPQYIPIPARIMPWGEVIFCWEFTEEEILEVVKTKTLWQRVLTFGGKFQPQLLSVEKPEMPVEKSKCIKCGVGLPNNELVCEECQTSHPN